MMKVLLIHFLLLLSPLYLLSQKTHQVSGTIRHHELREKISGVRITVMSKVIMTDSLGNYHIMVRDGLTRIVFTHKDFQTIDTSIALHANLQLDLMLLPKVTDMRGVNFKTSKNKGNFQKISSTEIGLVEIQVAQLKKVPAMGGEPDLIKALQLTPGIKRGTEGGVGMYVRGGGADQNLILLDDAVIYNAGHLLGFFSVFNTNTVKDMAVYKSGFPSAYGGRLSSVLDISTRDGNMKKFSAEGALSSISSNITLQGPIQKDKASFIFSARRSYIDQGFRLIGKQLPMYFYDLNGKINVRLGDKDFLSISSYYGRDVLNWNGKVKVKDTAGKLNMVNNLSIESNSDLGNFANTVKWKHHGRQLSSALSFIYSQFNYAIEGKLAGNQIYVESSIKDMGVKMDFNLLSHTSSRIKFGFNSVYRIFQPNTSASGRNAAGHTGSTHNIKKNNLENSVYINSENKLTKRLSGNYGLRISSLLVQQGKLYGGIEPRLSFRYMLDSSNSIKFSYTRMKQYVHLVSSSSITMPTDIWCPVSDRAAPESSDQVAMGYYTDFHKKGIYFSTELYYKRLNHIIELKEGSSLILNDDFEKDLLFGKGNAYGAEVFLNVNKGRFTAWMGYTLSWSNRQFDSINQGETYFSKYDRRHDVSLVGSYKAGKRWSVSLSWVYSSGNPFTAKIGQYMAITPSQNDFTTLPMYSKRNSHRFSSSHRLDIDVSYKLGRSKKFESELHFCMYNVYNRTQPSRVDMVKDANGNYKFQQKGLFGMIPAISYNFKF